MEKRVSFRRMQITYLPMSEALLPRPGPLVRSSVRDKSKSKDI